MSEYYRSLYYLSALFRGDGADLALGRADKCPFHDRRGAVFFKKGDERLTDTKLGYSSFRVQCGVGPEGLCCRLHGLLIFRGERPECMLDTVPELPKDALRYIKRVLAYEVDTNPL